MLLYQYLLTGWCISWISNFNYYPQTHVCAHAQWLSWSYVHHTTNHINACSIDRSPDYSHNAVASSYNTRFCCTTNAPGRKISHDPLHIVAQRSPTGASTHACFRMSIFFMRTFIKQLANFFTRTTFWSHPIVQQLWQAPKLGSLWFLNAPCS